MSEDHKDCNCIKAKPTPTTNDVVGLMPEFFVFAEWHNARGSDVIKEEQGPFTLDVATNLFVDWKLRMQQAANGGCRYTQGDERMPTFVGIKQRFVTPLEEIVEYGVTPR